MRTLRKLIISLIVLLAASVFMTGLFAMPALHAYAETGSEPALQISQITETESAGLKKDDYTFTYRLTADGNCPLPGGASADEWEFELKGDSGLKLNLLAGDDAAPDDGASIRFVKGGTYHYTLAQIIKNRLVTVDYDEAVYDIYVKVSWGRGLKLSAVWAQRNMGDKPDSIRFTNRARRPKVIGDPPVSVEKRIEGDVPDNRDEFVFAMTPARSDYPLPHGAIGRYEVTMHGAGEIEIGDIEFERPGVYEYTVSEKSELISNYEYDKTVYRVIYTIKQEADGSLSCDRQIIKDGGDGAASEKCVFTNVYHKPGNNPGGDSDEPRSGPEADPKDGGASGSGNISKGTKTGDSSNILIYLSLLFAASVVLAAEINHKVSKDK